VCVAIKLVTAVRGATFGICLTNEEGVIEVCAIHDSCAEEMSNLFLVGMGH